eukprot:1748190-Pleurochrysis_carterae.AAC.1
MTSVVAIIINTDSYPTETTWQLTISSNDDQGDNGSGVPVFDSGSGVVLADSGSGVDAPFAQGGPYSESLSNTELTFHYSLAHDANYTFTIFDGAQNGLCCAYGAGNWSLLIDGTRVAGGAAFGDTETFAFSLPFPEQLPLTSPASPPPLASPPLPAIPPPPPLASPPLPAIPPPPSPP